MKAKQVQLAYHLGVTKGAVSQYNLRKLELMLIGLGVKLNLKDTVMMELYKQQKRVGIAHDQEVRKFYNTNLSFKNRVDSLVEVLQS